MSLRKNLSIAFLASGLAVVGAAALFGSNEIPANLPDGTGPLVSLELSAVQPINTSRTEAVWRDWMVQNDVVRSSLAIGRAGAILHSAAQRRSPDLAYPMASLSKAITGMCLNQLLTNSPYSWDSTLADLAPEFAKMNFTPAPQMADLTLTQLATHTSGLPETLNYGTLSTRSLNLSSQPTMARAALREPSNFGPRGNHIYSNANYAILGFLIEAMTGVSYGEYCNAAIMVPAGATQAGVTGRMANTAAYGGWSVSTEDYARFAMYWFDPAQPWMTSPESFGYDQAAHYGMGTSVYPTRDGTYVSHFGRWTHADPQKPNIGSLFFVRADGTTVVVNWDGSLDPEVYEQLQQQLGANL